MQGPLAAAEFLRFSLLAGAEGIPQEQTPGAMAVGLCSSCGECWPPWSLLLPFLGSHPRPWAETNLRRWHDHRPCSSTMSQVCQAASSAFCASLQQSVPHAGHRWSDPSCTRKSRWTGYGSAEGVMVDRVFARLLIYRHVSCSPG